MRDRPSTFRLQSLRFPQLALRSTFPRVDSNGLSQPTTSHLVAFSYVSSYQIGSHRLTYLQLLWGRLADIYGRRLIFLWGSVFFTIFAIVTPFVPNEIGFDILRGLNGLAAAAMAPTALGILGTTFPPGKMKDVAFGCFGAGAPLGGVMGNIFVSIRCSYSRLYTDEPRVVLSAST
jgi:MFS family permease